MITGSKNFLDEFSGYKLPAAPGAIIKLVILWRLYWGYPKIFFWIVGKT